MKNKIGLILLISLVFLTGCGNTKTLNCSVTSKEEGGETVSNLRIKIKDNKIDDMRLTLNMTLSPEQKAYKQTIIEQMQQKTDRVYATNDGIKAIFGMDSSYFDNFGISKDAKIGEVKQVLELQGYTCE